MPYWTPIVPDRVVYTTVDEAHSGSVQDVGKFLSKLKRDLCIGKEGFPSHVILGDQQTYAHMKNLKITTFSQNPATLEMSPHLSANFCQ